MRTSLIVTTLLLAGCATTGNTIDTGIRLTDTTPTDLGGEPYFQEKAEAFADCYAFYQLMRDKLTQQGADPAMIEQTQERMQFMSLATDFSLQILGKTQGDRRSMNEDHYREMIDNIGHADDRRAFIDDHITHCSMREADAIGLLVYHSDYAPE